MSDTPYTLELWSTRKNQVDPNTFVGDYNRLFYNPETKTIQVSDGETPGGLPISGSGSTALYSVNPPTPSPDGLLWFNPDNEIFYIASDNSWVEAGGSGSSAITLYSSIEPTPTTNGLLWFNPDTSVLSVASDNQWVNSATAVIFSNTAPDNTNILWMDTNESGLVLAYISDNTTSNTSTWSSYKISQSSTDPMVYVRLGTLSTQVGVSRWYSTNDILIENITATVAEPPDGQSIILDINKNGNSILNSLLEITSGNYFSSTTPNVSMNTLTSGDYLTIDIDQVGNVFPGYSITVRVQYTNV